MDINEVLEALEAVAREKGVPTDTILDALANALVSAYKRTPGAAEEARVTIDPESGEILVYGQELDEDGNVTREWEDTPEDFGRIAATTAKQVIVQRLRDAKREQVFDIYEGREGDLVTGIVQQSDHRYAMLDLGDAEAIMPASERIPYERLERGNRVKGYILEVRGEGKGPQIVVSRSHPEFIRSLFELEVPELVDGDVEIKVIAREPGHRTKIAVVSNDPNVDPVGACVGARGSRVRQVVNELRGEKVDIVEWREDTSAFIAEALSPARVKEVRLDDEGMIATVIVPDHQLSLAIGKEGQNARLAARLTGYKIDIRSESEDLGLLPTDEEDEALAAAEESAEAAPAAEDAPVVEVEEVPPAPEGAPEESAEAAPAAEDDPAEEVEDAAPAAEDAPAEEVAPAEDDVESADSPDSGDSPDSVDSPDVDEAEAPAEVAADEASEEDAEDPVESAE
ncbi:MAG: transcription termination/antitermination protein NusA [bacterium]|nr:transcription termination/antitermination protein NusA [bacterium]